MIVNYYATRKTRASFCGLRCCGNSFGRCERRHKSGIINHKTLMRRYAKHADKLQVKKQIEMELTEEIFDPMGDDFVDDFCILEVEDEENKALYDAQEQEEAELRDEYYHGL